MNDLQPFYRDSGFWQFVVAGVAVLLSQCPPVRLWFKRAKLDVECFDRVVLNEEIGSPTAQWHLSIANTGGREVRIKKIALQFKRSNDETTLFARGYFEKLSDPQPTLLAPFRLAPTEEWSHGVTFMRVAPREARQTYSVSAKAIKENIAAKRANLRGDHPWVEADANLVQPLYALYDADFFWKSGEYVATLVITTSTPAADVIKPFRFTLFESESEQLRSHRDQLKFGNGVYFREPPVDPHYADVHPA